MWTRKGISKRSVIEKSTGIGERKTRTWQRIGQNTMDNGANDWLTASVVLAGLSHGSTPAEQSSSLGQGVSPFPSEAQHLDSLAET